MEDIRYREFTLPNYMLDCNSRLRPGAFMDLCQQAAGEEARMLGFPDSRLMERCGAVWVIARMEARFRSLPMRGDTVRLRTWHKGADKIFFLRDYQLLDTADNILADATSVWVVMDAAARKVMRIDTLQDIIPPQAQYPLHAIETVTEKIVVPSGCIQEKVAEHTVQYSDVDYNGHANNARYTVWAMDCIPGGEAFRSPLREIALNFNREARPGETVTLCHCQSDGRHYVSGFSGREQIFISRLEFGGV